MKKRIWIALFSVAVIFTGCGSQTDSTVQNTEIAEPVKEEMKQEAAAEADDTGKDEAAPEKTEERSNEDKNAAGKEESFTGDFKSTLSYIKKTGGKAVVLDYSVKPSLNGRKAKYSADPSYSEIEDRLGECSLIRVKAERKDNGLATTVDVYRNRETNRIEKIESFEYGSLRRVSGWYFKDGNIIYEYRYNDDIYGTNTHREEYSLKEDSDEVMNEGYLTYDAVKDVPGFAKIYGYVGDEFGGVLENVYATIKSVAYEYEEQVKTNGDGYYEFLVPVNTEDCYNISFTYGEFTPGSVNDISISEGTAEYPCGILYMAEDGKHVHVTDEYFLNANQAAPDELKEGEYEAVLTYETATAQLKPYFMSMSDGKTVTEEKIRFTPDSSGDFKLYIKDEKNYGSDNMAYDMSKSNARVTVFDKHGIAYCFNAPVVHVGVVWEVFEVRKGRILPAGNYYNETAEGVF